MKAGRVLAIIGALVPAAASAHHSLSGYDSSRQVALDAVVAEFHFTQPHPFLIVTVLSAKGAPERWRLEMDNLWELEGVGLNRTSFRPGDRVTVSGSPDRRGDPALYLRRLDRPADGLVYEQVGASPRVTRGEAAGP